MTSDAYCAAADRKSEYREVRTACCGGGTRVAKLDLFLVDKYHMKLVEVSMKEKLRVAMFGAAVIIGTKNRGTRD